VTTLAAHRTMALRNVVAYNPHVAMTALPYKLVIDTFQHRATLGCVEASIRYVFFQSKRRNLKDSPSARLPAPCGVAA
jgi:ParB family transcriptional regulator, chromosome partitioning protein